MENQLKLPNQLCQRIFSHEFQIDIGNVTEQLITKTIQLYVVTLVVIQQAISFYTSLVVQEGDRQDFDKEAANRRSQFYQDKIKRLLVRNDVQQCLLGKKNNACGLDLKKEISKMKENAPEQAKTLIEYFKTHMKQQDALIEQSLNRQTNDLNERIRRRSSSKGKKSYQEFARSVAVHF